jgi:1,4-alpha-glucan branching enzyme
VCVCNFAPVPRHGYRLGLPGPGRWREVLNSDAGVYGGSDAGNAGLVVAEDVPWHGQRHSATVVLPPLGVIWLSPEQ